MGETRADHRASELSFSRQSSIDGSNCTTYKTSTIYTKKHLSCSSRSKRSCVNSIRKEIICILDLVSVFVANM